MEIDVQKEIEKQVEEVNTLNSQLQQIQQQREVILQELFRKQGVIQYLQGLEAGEIPTGDPVVVTIKEGFDEPGRI